MTPDGSGTSPSFSPVGPRGPGPSGLTEEAPMPDIIGQMTAVAEAEVRGPDGKIKEDPVEDKESS